MRWTKNSRRLAAACYGLAALLWLAWGVWAGVRVLWARSQGQYLQSTLSAAELTRVSFENYADLEWDIPPYEDPDLYLSTDNDPQLIWQGSTYVERVVLYADHYTPPGAVVLYYLEPGQTDFSETQKVYAAVTGQGEYTFALGGRQVSALRIDPDSRGGIATRFTGIRLNPEQPWFARFVPTARQLFLLLVLPGLAAALAKLLGEIYYQGGSHAGS